MMKLWLLLASISAVTNAINITSAINKTKPPLLCAQVNSSAFNPLCLPAEIKTFSDIGNSEKPYIYLQWMFTETCGPYLAYFKSSFKTLPEVMSLAVTSVFMNWGIYVAGNFVGVTIMNIFEVAPLGRRCCGLFAERTDTYKKVVGPLYYLLFVYALVLMASLMWRFWSEVHKFRAETLYKEAAGGLWPVKGGGTYTVPQAPAACTDALNLMFPAYKDIFQILVLMVFTGVDCIFLAAQMFWTAALMCIVQCRCLCCYCCKGCCGICGWMICNNFAMMCCLGIPMLVVMLYYYVGVFGAFLYFGIAALLVGAVLMMVGYAIRYLLCLATCGYCKPLAIPFDEQKKVLFPFPPGQFFQKTSALDGHEDGQLQAMERIGSQVQNADPELAKQAAEIENGLRQELWEKNLGVPSHLLTAGFPSFYAVLTVPMFIIFNLVFECWMAKCQIVFAKSFADSNLDWFTAENGPTTVWPFAMQMVKAMFVGVTDGLHIVFADATSALVNDFTGTIKGIWEGAVLGMDPTNLFSDSFSNFMAAILMARFLLTVWFVCLRLTAVINRVVVDVEAGAEYDDVEVDEEEE